MFEEMVGRPSKAITVDEPARQSTNFAVWDSEAAARDFFSPERSE